jgi:hypothetical protein
MSCSRWRRESLLKTYSNYEVQMCISHEEKTSIVWTYTKGN